MRIYLRLLIILAFGAVFASLSACDAIMQKLGVENTEKKTAETDADGHAVGGACRQSGRALEDCYAVYAWLPRAAIFQGWREMDLYMRDNNIEIVQSELPPAPPPPPPKKKKAAPVTEEK